MSKIDFQNGYIAGVTAYWLGDKGSNSGSGSDSSTFMSVHFQAGDVAGEMVYKEVNDLKQQMGYDTAKRGFHKAETTRGSVDILGYGAWFTRANLKLQIRHYDENYEQIGDEIIVESGEMNNHWDTLSMENMVYRAEFEYGEEVAYIDFVVIMDVLESGSFSLYLDLTNLQFEQ